MVVSRQRGTLVKTRGNALSDVCFDQGLLDSFHGPGLGFRV